MLKQCRCQYADDDKCRTDEMVRMELFAQKHDASHDRNHRREVVEHGNLRRWDVVQCVDVEKRSYQRRQDAEVEDAIDEL